MYKRLSPHLSNKRRKLVQNQGETSSDARIYLRVMKCACWVLLNVAAENICHLFNAPLFIHGLAHLASRL